jgi:hypothetical protein
MMLLGKPKDGYPSNFLLDVTDEGGMVPMAVQMMTNYKGRELLPLRRDGWENTAGKAFDETRAEQSS